MQENKITMYVFICLKILVVKWPERSILTSGKRPSVKASKGISKQFSSTKINNRVARLLKNPAKIIIRLMKRFLQLSLPQIRLLVSTVLIIIIYASCHSNAVTNPARTTSSPGMRDPVKKNTALADATADVILNRPQVPILCYHQIRDWKASDSRRAKDYIVPVNNFREQIKMLAANGYHTILPDQLYEYLVHGASLPAKAIMITFDDTRAEQYSIGREELSKYGFKGVYFIMTVSLDKPGYMTKEEVRQLAEAGNIIGSHTWDHSNVKNYTGPDWVKQIDKPSQQLEKITGKPINYFAYPFGLWNKEAITQLKQRHFKAAFQLSARRDENDPLFTIRRIIVPGEWSINTLQKWMAQSF